MSSDDELDYMSEKVLFQCEKNDLRPGLIHNRSEQRKHTILKKKARTDLENKARYRPYKVIEQEKREEGLNKAISCENKGFALLQKMGYKPGAGIGKSGSGRVEPINIEVKADREGLGRKEALRLVQAEKMAIRKKMADQRNNQLNVEDYQMRMSRERAEKQVISDLLASQRVCMRMDQEEGLEEPDEPWFWPAGSLPREEDESQESDDGVAEEASGYDCGGGGDDGGGGDGDDDYIEGEDDANEDGPSTLEFSPSEKLDILTLYLRTTYCYCIWCGVRYDDNADLEGSCPGSSRSVH